MQDVKKLQNHKQKQLVNEESKKRERHIVTWTQEEDDVLEYSSRIHGTENWAIIASKFKAKTTRQCRRRWYTYLNSDFQKIRRSHIPDDAEKINSADRSHNNKISATCLIKMMSAM
ncbi:unnamed protein product [Lathyrus oleraceus]